MREALRFISESRPFSGVLENVQQMTVKDVGDSCSASDFVEQELKLMSYHTQLIHVNMGLWHRLTRHRTCVKWLISLSHPLAASSRGDLYRSTYSTILESSLTKALLSLLLVDLRCLLVKMAY